MDRREIEQLAELVVENLLGEQTAGRSPSGGSTSPVPTVGRTLPQAVGRWEVPDIGWRMPVGGRAGGAAGGKRGPARIADYVDHTLLKAEATRAQIEALCDEAAEHRFAAVCVNGSWVPLCRKRLAGSGVKTATVVGFPLGATMTDAKVAEARHLVESGADVVDATKARTVKVILESATLEPLQVVQAAAIAKEAGAHFVKTSTGFHPAGGATVEAVALMRLTVGDALGVKAAGGVRDCATALRMIAAGANRLGTSSGVQFVECMGAGPQSLSALLSAPDGHEAVCQTGGCSMD
jgi:deoxyribose-phosphate aldolase